ncbi:NADPH:quinone reductase-like Zn-dependent oxidoreductase [Deinobacterium chartae]|uniref:NADPH:quinone reductase-like Zn-dependent oxidoreductase n=1 Tax=Deinobacterium chartae TaxID=521158 RepID=A0A841HZF1_9DEIO|nr:NAD(P)-dependent alcohol dehydrogenase [Deinobacterium chartae]MBB6098323.1 NADPH:quinone reductase-like Zn-dependent oxidoreductase [Deinobacterium chartae]
MKAVMLDRYGSFDALKLRETPPPTLTDDGILVRVHAASVDAGVWHVMTGQPYLMRVMGFGFRKPKNPIVGMALAGQVVQVGARVTRFRPGDEVFGSCDGAFAEYACTDESRLAHKPAALTLEQAAALSISGCTALQALRDAGQVQAGQKVLVIGAGGGVGIYAVQLAKAFGAEVTGVCSSSKVELVRSIGADAVIDYTRSDFTRLEERYDLIVDTAGNRPLHALRRALTPQGTVVLVGGEGGNPWLGSVSRVIQAGVLSPFIRQNLRGLMSTVRSEDLEFLRAQVDAGKLRPVIDRTYPLHEVPEAVRYLHDGHARGKLIIRV